MTLLGLEGRWRGNRPAVTDGFRFALPILRHYGTDLSHVDVGWIERSETHQQGLLSFREQVPDHLYFLQGA